ncbi:Uncharacterised protein [Mycobacteroides abscessus subsp. abscessus]|nr:Uncharacterised protein [Mycobacteroides abscessus subsp. abscessus]
MVHIGTPPIPRPRWMRVATPGGPNTEPTTIASISSGAIPASRMASLTACQPRVSTRWSEKTPKSDVPTPQTAASTITNLPLVLQHPL